MSREPLLKLEDFLPYLVNRVGTAMVARFSGDALAAHNLTIDMWRVLAALSNNGGQRQIDLAGMTSIEPSTTSRVVTRLVRESLVTRSRSKTSNREVLVQLTAKGRALVRKLIPVAIALERSAAAGVPASELARMKQVLRKVYRNLSRS